MTDGSSGVERGEKATEHAVPVGGEHVSGVRPEKRRRRVIRPGTEHTTIAGPSAEEGAIGWSEGQSTPDAEKAKDAEYLRNMPPHWS